MSAHQRVLQLGHGQHNILEDLLGEGEVAELLRGGVPTPGNIYVNLGFFARRFSTVTDRFFRVLAPVS